MAALGGLLCYQCKDAEVPTERTPCVSAIRFALERRFQRDSYEASAAQVSHKTEKKMQLWKNTLISVAGGIMGCALILGLNGYLGEKRNQAIVKGGDFMAVMALAPAGEGHVLVVRTGCPACAKANLWLSDNGIKVRRVVSDKVPKTAEAILDKVGSEAVPTLITKDRVIVGFNEATWKSVLVK